MNVRTSSSLAGVAAALLMVLAPAAVSRAAGPDGSRFSGEWKGFEKPEAPAYLTLVADKKGAISGTIHLPAEKPKEFKDARAEGDRIVFRVGKGKAAEEYAGALRDGALFLTSVPANPAFSIRLKMNRVADFKGPWSRVQADGERTILFEAKQERDRVTGNLTFHHVGANGIETVGVKVDSAIEGDALRFETTKPHRMQYAVRFVADQLVFTGTGAPTLPPFHEYVQLPASFTMVRGKAGLHRSEVLLKPQMRVPPSKMPKSRTMPEIGPRCHELRVEDERETWRIVYRIDTDAIVIAEVFSKKTAKTPKRVVDLCRSRLKRYDNA